MTKIQFLWEQKGQELLHSSPQAPSFFTITNLMKTLKMKGRDQRVSQVRSIPSAVWAQLSNNSPCTAQTLREAFSYLWCLQWYMEFIHILTKVTDTTLFSFSRHFLLVLIQSYTNKDLVLGFVFQNKWMFSWTVFTLCAFLFFSSLYEMYFFVMNALLLGYLWA